MLKNMVERAIKIPRKKKKQIKKWFRITFPNNPFNKARLYPRLTPHMMQVYWDCKCEEYLLRKKK